MCLKKYYTCQTYTLDLQKTFDITWSGILPLGC